MALRTSSATTVQLANALVGGWISPAGTNCQNVSPQMREAYIVRSIHELHRFMAAHLERVGPVASGRGDGTRE